MEKMKRGVIVLIGIISAVILLVLIGPFLIPIPEIPGAVSEIELADPDSQFINLNGYTLHYKEMGTGEPVFLLLHGLGPGLFTWEDLMEPLSKYGRVIAIDRPAAGLSERPLGEALDSSNPYAADDQVIMILDLMAALEIDRVNLVGNSAGGSLAVYTYLIAPQYVESLILVDAAIYSGGGAPAFVKPLLQTPQLRRIGPLFVRPLFENPINFLESAWYLDSKINITTIEGYQQLSIIENWDLAFWELSIAGEELNLPDRIPEIKVPVLVVSGQEDEIVPLEDSQRLAEEILGASMVILPECGHLPQEECPIDLLEAIVVFINSLNGK